MFMQQGSPMESRTRETKLQMEYHVNTTEMTTYITKLKKKKDIILRENTVKSSSTKKL